MIGKKLADRFEIVSEIGRGGMGVVYKAHDPVLNRDVAIKLISPAVLTTDAEERFRAEAQVVAQMDHPSIVPIHDFGRHENSLFFVMPVVEGTTLRQLIRDRSLLLGDIVDIGASVSGALDYSHGRGIVHRDIKPENIMVLRGDQGIERVRVMDFGLAFDTDVSRITKTGVLVGTISYISPEQVQGTGVEARSDLYSLGVVLYECILNELPFAGDTQSVLYRIVHDLPQSPRDVGVDIDPELESLVLSCMAKDPDERPQTAAGVTAVLKEYRSRMQDSDRQRSLLITRSAQLPRPAQAPFVGRREELKELQQRLNAAVRGECQFVSISGEAGAGKTRLLDELEGLCQARKVRVLHGRFVEQEGAFPYYGFCEAIQEYFRQKEAASSPGALPDFADLADDLVSLFPMLAEVPAISSAITKGSGVEIRGDDRSPENKNQIYELLARTMIRLSESEPLVFLFEDLHGAEASVDALQYVVRRLGPTPTLVVGTHRTTDVDRRHPLAKMLSGFRGDRRFASLVLSPLTASEHRAFLSTLIGGSDVVDELADRIYEGTEGNPFFTKELVRSLLDSGSIVRTESGAWGLSGGATISPEALPATIQQAVEERVDRLPDELRDVLSIASVMGRTFDFGDLERLAGDARDLDDAVDRLIQQGLIEEDRQSRGDLLTFSSGVVREVLYAQLSRRKRRSLHRRYAAELEKQHAGKLEGIYPQLVYHNSEGDVPEKAVEYGLLHARKSLEAFSADEAIRSAKAALDFLDSEWEGDRILEADAQLLLASAHQMAGAATSALRETKAAVKVLEKLGEKARVAETFLAGARIAWQARQTEEMGRWVERGLEAAREADVRETLRELLSLAGTLANLRGDYEKAEAYLKELETVEPDTAGPEETWARGGRLVVGVANPVNATEPVEIVFVEETEIFRNVFETLLANDAEGNLIPLLCERWEPRDEGRSFVLTLAAAARFHDGHALGAEDVKRSLERSVPRAGSTLPPGLAAIRGVENVVQGRTGELEGVTILSDGRLEIHLREALPIYPAMLTDRRMAVVRETGNPERPIVGTGPFRMAAHEPERVVVERDEDDWRGRSAPLDSIEFRVGMTAAAIAEGLRSGELDIARDLLPEDLEEILRDPRFRNGLVEAPQKFTYFVLFNCTDGPMRDTRVRKALAGVVRPHDLVWRNLGRFAQPAVGLLPPGILGHDAGRRNPLLSPDEAAELLKAAKLQAPIRLKAAVHPLIQDRYAGLLEALLASWSALGVSISVETPDMDAYLRAWDNSEGLDLVIGRWGSDYDDPDNFTHSLFDSTVGELRTYFRSTETDQILEQGQSEVRPAEREGLYRRFDGWLLERAVVVPLFHNVDYRIAGPRVRGLELHSVPPFVNYSELGKVEKGESGIEVAPAVGGTLMIPMAGSVHSLDPALCNTYEQAEVLPGIFETLVRGVGQAQMVPWLASEFQATEGGRKYRFRLRDDVRFHDGRRLTARDVRFSLERLLQNAQSEVRTKYAPMRGAAEIIDGKRRSLAGFQIRSAIEFVIDLERPMSFFPALLSFPAAAVLPEGTDHVGRSWQDGAVGTGPFRAVEFQPGERIDMERNPTYWRRGYPKADRLSFRFDVPPDQILEGYREGRFTLAADLFPKDVEALRRDAERARLYREVPRLNTYFITFNTRSGPMSDEDARRRLVRSVDLAAMVEASLGRLAIPAQGLIPPGLLGSEPRPAAARPTPAPGGPSSSPPVELTAAMHPIMLGEYSSVFESLSRAFLRQGFKVVPVTKSMEEYVEKEQSGEVDLTIGRWIADYPEADTFTFILHTKGGDVGGMCGSPEIDALIDRGRGEADPAARHAIYRQVEERLRREARVLPLFHEQAYCFIQPDLEGLTLSYLHPLVNYEDLRIRTR